MTTIRSIQASLSSVRTDLAEVFPRLSDEMLEWAPADGMRTVKGQFVEILGTETSLQYLIQALPRPENDVVDAPFWATKTVDCLRQKTDEVRQATLTLLRNVGDEGLQTPVEVSAGFAEYLDLDVVTIEDLFRFISRHESYHAGQLVSYLWMRGDNPYDWEA
ncbi:MAG: DinB family protein [Armatimonadetes bacterium]|nr:DinB family protein [Armatimonadota bacterium]